MRKSIVSREFFLKNERFFMQTGISLNGVGGDIIGEDGGL